MNSSTLIILFLLLIVIFLLIHKKSPEPIEKVTLDRPPEQIRHNKTLRDRRFRNRTLRSGVDWRLGASTAPPLPLSTMYEIRIGRKVLSNSGPGDPVWDFDHQHSTGPYY